MRASREAAAEVEITLRRGGERAFFIVETASRARTQDLAAHLAGRDCETRFITTGPVAAWAARVRDGAADSLASISEYLRGRYTLSICEPGFTASMYRVALQLARDAEGQVHPVEPCTACEAPEPFPTLLRLQMGERVLIARLCDACLPPVDSPSPEDLCRGILGRSGGTFSEWQDAPLGPAMETPGGWRFRVECDLLASARSS